MKKIEIVIGGYYFDGKRGVRRVIDGGVQFKLYDEQVDDDCVQFRVLHSAKRHDPDVDGDGLGVCTRSSMASWAKARIGDAIVPQLLAALEQERIKLTPTEQRLLEQFSAAAALEGQALPLPGDSTRPARALARKGVINIRGKSAATLTLIGAQWFAHPNAAQQLRAGL